MTLDQLAIPVGSRWTHHSLPGVYVVENVRCSGRVALRRRRARFEVWSDYLLANFKRLAATDRRPEVPPWRLATVDGPDDLEPVKAPRPITYQDSDFG